MHQHYDGGYIVIAELTVVERVGRSKRAKGTERRSQIDSQTRVRIRQLPGDGSSLRKIAEDVGVSHENLRQMQAAATRSREK